VVLVAITGELRVMVVVVVKGVLGGHGVYIRGVGWIW